jgi:hypothetical protein
MGTELTFERDHERPSWPVTSRRLGQCQGAGVPRPGRGDTRARKTGIEVARAVGWLPGAGHCVRPRNRKTAPK